MTSLHFVDNTITLDDTKKKDKIWKIRPWVDSVRNNCSKVTPEEHCSVDEMMVSLEEKPVRYVNISKASLIRGDLNWGRAGMSGIL